MLTYYGPTTAPPASVRVSPDVATVVLLDRLGRGLVLVALQDAACGWLKLGRRLAGGLPHPARAGWLLWRRPGPPTRLRFRLRRRIDGAVLLQLRLWLLLSSCSWGRALWAGLRFAGRPFLPTTFLLGVHRRCAIFAHAWVSLRNLARLGLR